jgi:hypothetical protein
MSQGFSLLHSDRDYDHFEEFWDSPWFALSTAKIGLGQMVTPENKSSRDGTQEQLRLFKSRPFLAD